MSTALKNRKPSAVRHTIPCSFLGVKGLCGSPCYRGTCSRHRLRPSMPLCKHCGIRGTTAPHGYCASVESGCRWRAMYQSRLIKEDRRAMSTLIDELLSWDWEGFNAAQSASQ